MVRVERSNSFAPTWFSRAAIRALKAGCESANTLAARVKLRASIKARKARRSRVEMSMSRGR
ncbi:hypothetical protein D3C87_2172020 [compost metagenome]